MLIIKRNSKVGNHFFNSILLSLILLTSCKNIQPLELPKACEFPVCGSVFGNVQTLDTLSRSDKPYMKISPVKGLSSGNANEWSISFSENNNASVTIDNQYSQYIQEVNLVGYDSILHEKQHINDSFSIGFRSHNSQTNLVVVLDKNGEIPNTTSFCEWNNSSHNFSPYKHIDVSLHRWKSHLTVTKSGKFLFFTSDFNKKNTGLDLYVCMYDGAWSMPFNCGTVINSSCDDISPFVPMGDRFLYFSSNGHPGNGGYDLFKCTIDTMLLRQGISQQNEDLITKSFTIPENLGNPINTIDDELFPSSPVSPDTLLYYSTNHHSTLNKSNVDLFVFYRQYPSKSEIVQLQSDDIVESFKVNTAKVINTEMDTLNPNITVSGFNQDQPLMDTMIISGIILDDVHNLPITNVEIRSLTYPDLMLIDKQLTDSLGKYSLKVFNNMPVKILTDSKDYFFTSSVETFIKDGEHQVIYDPIVLPTILSLRINFPTKNYDSPYRYLIDTNGIETNTTWREALSSLSENLKRYSNEIVKVRIIGHTDDIGTTESNIELGRKRALFFIKELTSLGVNPDILFYESKGESVSPKKKKGESKEQYRLRSRRVEILKQLK